MCGGRVGFASKACAEMSVGHNILTGVTFECLE